MHYFKSILKARGLHADIKLFADNTSLFSIVNDIVESASKLNNDLIRIQE